jgi:hypothetical protein
VFTEGDAPFLGSLGDVRLAAPIVDLASTPSGKGYWLVGADGGVFAFGDARFLGGVAGTALGAPVVAVTPTRSGGGYWLLGADGGVFAFGDARYAGGLAGTLAGSGLVDLAALPNGKGYWLLSAGGEVTPFGTAVELGGPQPGQLTTAAVALLPTPSGKGYWMATEDGGVFTYGDAPFLGSSSGRLKSRVVALAAGPGRSSLKASGLPVAPAAQLRSRYGNDVSWPQCGGALPPEGFGFSVVGVTGGRPFSQNPCFAEQWRWASTHGDGAGVYLNLAWTNPTDRRGLTGPAGTCAVGELPCLAYNASAANVREAIEFARANGANPPVWWLDVEIFNQWSPYKDLNSYVVKAAIDTLAASGVRAGIYSSPLMWRRITGGVRFDVPIWLADIVGAADAPGWCGPERAFSGGPIWMVQALPGAWDINWACDPVAADPGRAFVMQER